MCRGQTPAQAEWNYLNKVKWLEMYGVDMHVVMVRDARLLRLGALNSVENVLFKSVSWSISF